MDKQLESIYALIKSGDLKKVLKGIEQTSRLPEPLALGFFELARRQARLQPELDAEAIETAIASTGRTGLNPAQVAEQLAAQLNQRSSLTPTQYEILGAMLAVLREGRSIPPLLQNGVIQIDALAELARRSAEPTARRELVRRLSDWRGRQRPDTVALVSALPFLKTEVERFARRSVFEYPTRLLINMREAFTQGRASAGFFLAIVILLIVVTSVLAMTRPSTKPELPSPPPGPGTAQVIEKTQQVPPPPTLRSELAKVLAQEPTFKRFTGATVIVLDDDDALVVIEELSRLPNTPRILDGRGAFGLTLEGCDWLEPADWKLMKAAPEEKAMVFVACFTHGKHGKQLSIVHYPAREIVLAVTIPGTPRVPPPTSTFLAEADDHMRAGDVAQAELSLRKARAAASTRIELGRFHRHYAIWLHSQRSTPELIVPHVRRALLYLPDDERQTIPQAIPRTFDLLPGFGVLEQQMTTVIPPAPKEKK